MALSNLTDHAPSSTSVVLLHGAGDTGRVWRFVRSHLDRRTLAPDLPGRGTKPADITAWDPDVAARDAAREIDRADLGDIIVVAHSAGAVLAPATIAHMASRVRHLVLVAGLTAAEGGCAADNVDPEGRRDFAGRLPELLRTHRGHTLVSEGRPPPPGDLAPLAPGLAMPVDSLRLMTHPISWAGVPSTMGRTFIRCLGDEIQPRSMQARLIAAAGATEVVDIDSGHAAARERPAELAEMIEIVARRYDG